MLEFLIKSVSLHSLENQRRFLVDNLMLGVQLANRCSSHCQGKSEARCESAWQFIGVAPELAHACGLGLVQRSKH